MLFLPRWKFAKGRLLSKGHFEHNALNGPGIYTFSDGRVLRGNYLCGELNGSASEWTPNGRLSFLGNFKEGLRSGKIELFFEDGGSLCGELDEEGLISGDRVTYFYNPRRTCGFIGQWCHGKMRSARFFGDPAASSVQKPEEQADLQTLALSEKAVFEREYYFDLSTKRRISREPLLADPYELHTVYVQSSQVAGEGLFARRALAMDEVCAFYNGIRVPQASIDARSWQENENAISLNDQWALDVPRPYDRTSHYRASLAHKANHAFLPNVRYAPFDHPRFGNIKCIRTLRPISAGEELLVSYDYHHGTDGNDVPCWYKKLQMIHIVHSSARDASIVS